ncbi:DUF3857 domain-containing protein [Maribellus sp. YY47]|uniref:DUF3857 domain-containing protein n=1 Tax=Maribellus sp. YY47 TaxID=2929486 RepID=UPI002000D546|nr:DUF3857 domain-containing protein [Maribellus sp. YY47]MCK3684068.1 DUF3857 and transglutaminase domain-containing protein [Maribellus sp. YY47]
MKSLLMLALICNFSIISFAENNKVKFGKIEQRDLEMKVYDQDTSASAVILYEKGNSAIRYVQGEGWKLYFTKHQRIKILKKEGVEYADFKIGLNASQSSKEEVNGLKAITFNLEDGKIIKDELNRKDVHLEEVNKFHNMQSFSLPNVKVGSVIDVEYTIDCKSFFRNMRPWRFQHSIPTVYSEYEVLVPEYFRFRQFTLGFERFTLAEETKVPDKVTLTSKMRSGGNSMSATQTQFNTDVITFNSANYHYIAENMPEFKEEAYTSTVDNFIQQVQFELQYVQFPGDKLYTYSQSWESINKDLAEDDEFGEIIFGPVKLLEEETQSLVAGAGSNKEKVGILLTHVRDNYKFNGFYNIYSKGLRNVIKDKNGNVADINFLLAGYLRAAGFEVKPVVLSTRSNGAFVFPTVTGFNYVVLLCEVDGEKLLLDAANKSSGINELPYQCLNSQGLVVGGAAPEWVELMELGRSDANYVAILNVNTDGKLSGSLKIGRKGYSAQSFRDKVDGFNSVEKYIEDFSEKKQDWEITTHELEGVNALDERVLETIELSVTNKSIFAGDKIYVSPIIFNALDENPFKLMERKYPVDFGFVFKESEMTVFNVPEGYVVEEVPESLRASLPENKALFLFSAQKIGDRQIHLTATLSINKPVLMAEDYGNLKELFNMIIEKQNQQIVLKKI